MEHCTNGPYTVRKYVRFLYRPMFESNTVGIQAEHRREAFNIDLRQLVSMATVMKRLHILLSSFCISQGGE
jgi:hypothetical protein